jgi:hypothetical protein
LTAPERKLHLSAQQELDACHPLVIEQAVTDLSCGTRLGANHPFRASSMIRSQVIERIGAILSRKRRPAMSDRQISNLREVYERCAIEDITGAGNLISEETRRAIFDRVAEVQAPAFDEPAGECRKSAESAAKDDLKSTNPKTAIGDRKVPLALCSPIASAHWALAQFIGMCKYQAWNWRVAGVRSSTYVSAIRRHLDAYVSGEELDPVDGTHHLGNIMACAAILLDAQAAGKLNDDRPPSVDCRETYDFVEKQMAAARERYKHIEQAPYTIEDTRHDGAA